MTGLSIFLCCTLAIATHFVYSARRRRSRNRPPRYQPGVKVPFVFSEEIPWGWLEYFGGSFHGQRLALKRAIITIGRDEQCDIWLDDDMASRHHAELAWDNGKVYLTDCKSLNGVLLNKQPVRGTVLVKSNDLLQVGAHQLVFVLAEQKEVLTVQDDPLTRHTWRSTHDLQTEVSQPVPFVEHSVESMPNTPSSLVQTEMIIDTDSTSPPRSDQTAQPDSAAPLQLSDLSAILLVLDGEQAGHRFILEPPLMTVGRGSDCDIVINDASISRQHAQFLRQTNEVYVQDLGSCNGSKVNDEPLLSPRLLKSGDILSFGNIYLEYTLMQSNNSISLYSIDDPSVLPPLPRTGGGPLLLKLPSRQKS